jgi:hypothetical protein
MRSDAQLTPGRRVQPIKVSIYQFYGIEINDFAATVAKTALWIAESQMMKETEDILGRSIDFLPLKTYNNIPRGQCAHPGLGKRGAEGTPHLHHG